MNSEGREGRFERHLAEETTGVPRYSRGVETDRGYLLPSLSPRLDEEQREILRLEAGLHGTDPLTLLKRALETEAWGAVNAYLEKLDEGNNPSD